MKKNITLLLLLTLILSSCVNYSSLRINSLDINKFNMKSASDILIEVKLGIENPLNTGVFIKELNGDIKYKDAKFARVELVSSDTVLARSIGVYRATLKVVIDDPMMLLSMGINFRSLKLDEYVADAKIKIANTNGGVRKIKIKNYSLDRLSNK